MSLCINPRCLQPDHPGNDGSFYCQSCGSDLVLLGRYRVMRLLSDKSGFGLVYEAFDRSVPKILKVLRDKYSHNEKAVELFQQEAAVLSQLPHAGIPAIEPQSYFQVFPRGSKDPLHCIVMEKIDGPNLKEWMKQQGNHAISEKQALNWMRQITEVLHLVHQKNYFHRDIKPENIMLRSSGQIVLVDFGAAREMTYTYLEQLGKTGGITRISSAGYTPPEQEKGQAVPQSDFYALGCTFIYLLTGKQPTDHSMYDSMRNAFHWHPYAPHVSSGLASLIDRMTAPRASDRPKNTQEILDTLTQIEAERAKPPVLTRLLNNPTALLPWHDSTIVQSQGISGSELRRTGSRVLFWGGALALVFALGGYGVWRAFVAQQKQMGTTESIAVQRTLSGHSSFVNSVVITSDDTKLLSGSADKTIKVWDLVSGQVIRTLTGHASFVNSLIFTPDGKILVSAGADQTVRLWDLATGQQTHVLTGHTGFVNALAVSPDGKILASGGADQTIRMWDLATGQPIRTLTGHTGYVNSLAFSPDGQTLVSGSADQTIRLWNVATGQALRTITGHTSFVNAVLFTPDGQSVVSASADKTIRLWDLASGQERRRLVGHTSFVNVIALSPDGQTLVSGSSDQTIRIWNLATGQPLHTIVGYGAEIKSFAISHDWQTIATGSSSTTIRLFKFPK